MNLYITGQNNNNNNKMKNIDKVLQKSLSFSK